MLFMSLSPRVQEFILRVVAAERSGGDVSAVFEEAKAQLSDAQFNELNLFFSTISPKVREVLIRWGYPMFDICPKTDRKSLVAAIKSNVHEVMPELTDAEAEELRDYFKRLMDIAAEELERRGLDITRAPS
jgi:hypothetical protein